MNIGNIIGKILDPLKGQKTKIGVVGLILAKGLIASGVVIPGWIIPVILAWTGGSAIGHLDRWIEKFRKVS